MKEMIDDCVVSVIGAAAVGDYIFHVEKLPEKGEIVKVNFFEPEIRLGGCAPNIAAGISSLGMAQPILVYPVGEDWQNFALAWEQKGIKCSLKQGEGKSGVSWMYMQDDGTTMCFAWEGVSSTVSWEKQELSDFVIIAPTLNPFTLAALEQAIGEKKEILITGIANEVLVPYLGAIAFLSINQYEFETLKRILNLDDDGFFNRYPALTLILTAGKRGSRIVNLYESYQIEAAEPDEILDYTGAGDAYVAGFSSAYIKGYSLKLCGYIGSASASFALQQLGGQENPPSWGMLVTRLMEQFPTIGREIQKDNWEDA